MSVTQIIYCESKDYLITGGREGTSKYFIYLIFIKKYKIYIIYMIYICIKSKYGRIQNYYINLIDIKMV